MEGNVLQSSGHFVFDSRKIPHKNHVTLDNDIIVGGGHKSSDVYAEGRGEMWMKGTKEATCQAVM